MLWGLSPLYWKFLRQVPSLEIILHRVVWSFLFLLVVIVVGRRWTEFKTVLKTRRHLLILSATSVIVSSNWLLYVWSVNNDQLLQASLGYYINPLVSVLLGMIFLKERLRLPQKISVLLVCGGVLYLTVFFGRFPWISLYLAFSFGFYGLIRKVAAVSSLIGLTVETLLLSIPAAAYLTFLNLRNSGAFLNLDLRTDLFLLGASVVTATPLLFFTISTKRLNLSTVGFLQYIAPTCMFLLGIFLYDEPFTSAQIITFILIWLALLLYSIDSFVYYRS